MGTFFPNVTQLHWGSNLLCPDSFHSRRDALAQGLPTLMHSRHIILKPIQPPDIISLFYTIILTRESNLCTKRDFNLFRRAFTQPSPGIFSRWRRGIYDARARLSCSISISIFRRAAVSTTSGFARRRDTSICFWPALFPSTRVPAKKMHLTHQRHDLLHGYL